jgi:hypothetical protein
MKRGTASIAAAGGLALLYDIQSSRHGPRDEARASNGGKRARPRRLHSELGEIEHGRLLRGGQLQRVQIERRSTWKLELTGHQDIEIMELLTQDIYVTEMTTNR